MVEGWKCDHILHATIVNEEYYVLKLLGNHFAPWKCPDMEREREREPKTTVNHSFMPRADSTNNHKIIVVKIWPNNGEHMGCTLFGWSASPGQPNMEPSWPNFCLFYMWKTKLIESNLLATITSFGWKTSACHYPKTCLLATITSFGWKALACHYPKYAFFGYNDFFWVENIGLPLS
jgi:hypothetical protein